MQPAPAPLPVPGQSPTTSKNTLKTPPQTIFKKGGFFKKPTLSDFSETPPLPHRPPLPALAPHPSPLAPPPPENFYGGCPGNHGQA